VHGTKLAPATSRPTPAPPPAPGAGLCSDRAARLAEFARACKAAARAVSLYPAAHPAIGGALTRLVESARRAAEHGALTLTVLPQSLLVGGDAPVRPDPAIAELAALLHAHQVGSLTVAAETDADTWRAFLLLIARAPEELIQEGGITKAWAAGGTRDIEVREIDYAEVLRERSAHAATWDEIVGHYLQGDAVELDAKARHALLEIATDAARLSELAALVAERGREEANPRGGVLALAHMLESVVQLIAQSEPAQQELVLENIAAAAGRLSIETMSDLMSGPLAGIETSGIDLRDELEARISDAQLGGMVARSVIEDRGASARLAEALHALVPDEERQHRVLQCAREEVAESPLGLEPDFEPVWDSVVDLVAGYSDSSFVGGEYARELSVARTQALDVEQTSDDPPERVSAWLATVSDGAVRGLDVELLLDLLRVEGDPAKWRALTGPVKSHIEDLLLVGGFDDATRLIGALTTTTGTRSAGEWHASATDAIARLVGGPMMRHLASHLRSADDHTCAAIKALCHALGEPVVQPLADALSAEERERPRQRLTELLISFGALGRHAVERLKSAPSATVRRTAIYLLREFGGSDALPELETLLGDAEPNVQREAIRAIVAIGTDDAFAILQKALESGSASSRNVLMQSLTSIRDDRAASLFAYILTHVDHRGSLRGVYVRAVEALGALESDDGVDTLKVVLLRGEWYAPFRTAALRQAAATSLARIASPAALGALDDAARDGSRGTRAAARAALDAARPARNRQGSYT
jgi:HEAT repeat protein